MSTKQMRRPDWSGYAFALAVTAGVSGLSHLGVSHLEIPDIVLLHQLGAVVVATRHGLGPSLVSAIAGALAFDYLFIPPVYQFWVDELRHVVTLAIMIAGAVTVSGLTERLRLERARARSAERRTAILYGLELELARAEGAEQLAAVAIKHIEQIAEADVTLVAPLAHSRPAGVHNRRGNVKIDAASILDETAREVLASGD
ncbi:MAG TPA: DUF4118 domain-containing protein, partial [Polyangiaceae bacterium]|nr:DUF4118 domain-containing protein [Polyangiaceae bacterium]